MSTTFFFFYFQSCTLRDLKTPKAEITAAGKGNAGNGTCEHWVHLYFCPLPANGSLGGIWLHTWDTSVATPSHEGLQFLVLVEHRKCLWSDALWFCLSLSPCLSHSVFTENRGDQSFKIHHSTEMGRRKHPPKTRSASPRGEKQQRCYKSAENLYLSPLPGWWNGPSRYQMLQIWKYQLGVYPISPSVCPPGAADVGVASGKGQDLGPGPVQLHELLLPPPLQAHTGRCEILDNTLSF